MTGLVGRMFREFALTLTIAVVVSAIVSLTLTPMMAAKLLKHEPESSGNFVGRAFNWMLDAVVEGYRRSLEWVLRHQAATLWITVLTVVITVWMYVAIPKGFLPAQDTGLITAVLEAEPQVSFTEISRLQAEVTAAVRKDPAVEGVVSVVGVGQLNPTPNVSHIKVTLKPRAERKLLIADVITRLERAVSTIPGVTVYFQRVQDVQIATRTSRAQYQYTLVSTDAAEVKEWTQKLGAELRLSPALSDVNLETMTTGLRARIDVDREVAGRLGVTVQAVSDALNDAFGQRQVSTIYAQANQYRVVLEAMSQFRSDPSRLNRLYIPSSNGSQVPLAAIAKISYTTAPLAVSHQDQFPSETISFNLEPHAALSDAVRIMSDAEAKIGMPSSVTGGFFGDASEFASSLRSQPWLILAAVVTIYIVLGVLYESFVHPFTILTTLPSAGIGALLALMFTGLDLSLVALIGIVLLMGIVKKNAIMMIDFALDAERERGLNPRDSIVEAALLRFRPIMMTTLAALFGALPLAIESGVGSELRNPLGITIVGGLLLSQLLTLYTTPVIYLAMERLRARISGAPAHPATGANVPAE
jgi:multidrug efflux pump